VSISSAHSVGLVHAPLLSQHPHRLFVTCPACPLNRRPACHKTHETHRTVGSCMCHRCSAPPAVCLTCPTRPLNRRSARPKMHETHRVSISSAHSVGLVHAPSLSQDHCHLSDFPHLLSHMPSCVSQDARDLQNEHLECLFCKPRARTVSVSGPATLCFDLPFIFTSCHQMHETHMTSTLCACYMGFMHMLALCRSC
jgi:hypothetical protein